MSAPGPPPRKRQQVQYAPPTRPIDRDLPRDFAEIVPEAELYERMRACERRADVILARKRHDLQDQLSRPRRAKRTLRIWVSNTASDQPWQVTDAPQLDDGNFDFETTNIPSWELRIEGKLLPSSLDGAPKHDDGEDVTMQDSETTQGVAPKAKDSSTTSKPLFTDFLRSVTIEEVKQGPGSYAEGPILEWHKPKADPPQHQRATSRQPGQSQQPPPPSSQAHSAYKPAAGIAVKRKGDAPVQVSIAIVLDHKPDKYKVSPILSRMLDISEETRAQIVMDLWLYIRANNLLDSEDRRVVNADAALKEAFGHDRLYFPQVPDLLTPHLSPATPCVIDYTVRTDAASTFAPRFYDVEVEVDDGTHQETLKTLQAVTAPLDPRAAQIDAELADLMPVLETGMSKRTFMKSLANDPARFLNDWQASQARDLEIICGDVKYANQEEVRQARFYRKEENKAWLKEGVFHYLASLSR